MRVTRYFTRVIRPFVRGIPVLNIPVAPFTNQKQDFPSQAQKFYTKNLSSAGFVLAQNPIQIEDAIKNMQTPTVLYCSAEWCQPCKVLLPKLSAFLAKANVAANYIKIDIDKLPSIAEALQVKAVPTVFLIHKGRAVDMFQGVANDKKLEQFAQKLASLSTGEGSPGSDSKGIQSELENIQSLIAHKKYDQALQSIEAMHKQKDKRQKCEYVLVAFKSLCYASSLNPALYLSEKEHMETNFKEQLKKVPSLQDLMKLADQRFTEFTNAKKKDANLQTAIQTHKTNNSIQSHQELIRQLDNCSILLQIKQEIEQYVRRPNHNKEFLKNLLKGKEGAWWNSVRKLVQRALY